MTADFVVFAQDPIPHACSVLDLQNVEDDFELLLGTSRAKGFPRDAAFHMDPDAPDDMQLTDFLYNADMLLIASGRAREIIASHDEKTEFLPVTIFDHKRKKAKEPYFIANPVGCVDALDAKKSGATYSRLVKTMVNDIRQLVLDPDKIPDDRALFRLAGFPKGILASRELASAIDNAGLTGARWVAIEDFPEE